MYIECKDYPVTWEPWKRPTSTVSRQMWTRQRINSFRTVYSGNVRIDWGLLNNEKDSYSL